MNKHIQNKVDEIKGYLLNYQSVIDTNYSLFENLYELLKFEKEVGDSRYRREINDLYWAIFSFYCKSIYEEHILYKVQDKERVIIAKEIVRDTYNIEYENQELFNRYMQEENDDIKYREFKYSAFQRGDYSNKVNLLLLTDLKILKNGFLKSDRNDPLDPHFLWQDFTQAVSRANLFGGKSTLLTKICILYDELDLGSEYSEQLSYSQYIDKYKLSDNDTQLSDSTLSLIKKGRPKQSLRDRLICDEQKKDQAMKLLHQLIDGKIGKDVALVVASATLAGLTTKITYVQAKEEFGDIGNQSGYNAYVKDYKTKYSSEELDAMTDRIKREIAI